MKFKELIETLESNRASVSKAKSDLETISYSSSKEVSADLIKKLNTTINSLSKMIDLAQEEVGFDMKSPVVTVKNNVRFHSGNLMLKDGFCGDTKTAIVIGVLNLTSSNIKNLSEENEDIKYKIIINQNTNERVVLGDKYYTAQKSASKSLDEALKILAKS